MIELHYAPTPNGWKISIMLEACGLPYTLRPMQLGRGDQHTQEAAVPMDAAARKIMFGVDRPAHAQTTPTGSKERVQ